MDNKKTDEELIVEILLQKAGDTKEHLIKCSRNWLLDRLHHIKMFKLPAAA